nr:MAG TPA: hypothetical protein [Caudoviricetes sp.]
MERQERCYYLLKYREQFLYKTKSTLRKNKKSQSYIEPILK